MSFPIVQFGRRALNSQDGGFRGPATTMGIVSLVLNFALRDSSTCTGLYGQRPRQGCSGQSRNWFTGGALQFSVHSIRTQVLQKVRVIVHPRMGGIQGVVKRRRRVWVLWNGAWKQRGWIDRSSEGGCQRLLCVTMTSRVNANRACH